LNPETEEAALGILKHMSNLIDINFNVYSDTPAGKDPDTFSPTLRKYHKFLWSKPLPNGINFNLTDSIPKVLYHQSDLGEFFLSSDSIGHTYRRVKSMSHIINQIPQQEIDSFFKVCSTIGGYIIFPAKKIDNKMTMNGSRGLNRSIVDRFDLTLECIRLHYKNEDNPLSDTLQRYSSFFNPSIIFAIGSLDPTTPTIPHIYCKKFGQFGSSSYYEQDFSIS
jgi:hypothetical protein